MKALKRIVIIGNGFGGVYAFKNLHKFFHDRREDRKIEITLIGEKNYFLFTPLLHEVATGTINPSNIIEPIRKILGCCLDKFYLGRAEFIDTKNRIVHVDDNLVPYDYLILAPGSKTNFYDIPGAEKFSFTLKSIDDAIRIKNHCIMQMERAVHTEDQEERKKMLAFTMVGGGATGVELAAEIEELVKKTFARYYPENIIKDVSILLIQKAPELVPQFAPQIQKKSLAVLRKKGINVMLGMGVKEVTNSYIVIDGDTKIPTETVIWVGGIAPAELKFNEHISTSPDKRLIVNEYLQLENHPEIFAIGDIALFTQENSPLPALAQVAEKEAKNVAKNIKLLMENRPLEKFVYHSMGSLLSLGQWMAVGEIHGITFSGYFAWWLWRTVYLSKLISWRKKVRVAVDWTMNIRSPRDMSQL